MRAQRRYGRDIGTIDTTSSTPNPTFRQRHCLSVRNTRANNSPAKHHSDNDAIAAKPNASPSNTPSRAGPDASAANDAAAPSVIAQPFGLCQSIQTPLTTLPLSTPRQPATAGDSQADEPDEKPKRGSLAGVVKLDGTALGDMPAVITLEPADGRFRRRAPRSAIMEQRGREFAPHMLTVPRGSTVTFPNFDSIYHNVFSRSGAAPFDLGIYRSGQARSYVFDKEGIVHLGCNLHRNMSAYVVVVSEPHYVISDGKGRFRFRSLEPGRYKARVWTEKSEPVTRELTVGPEENQVTFELHARAAEPDVDKFGAAR